MAPVQDQLWMVRNDTVYMFSPQTEQWSIKGAYTGGDDTNQTVADYDGKVYGYSNSGEIVQYSIATEMVSQESTGLGSLLETRMVYDPGEHALFFGAYDEPYIYRFDLNSNTLDTNPVATVPEDRLNTIFCGDHSGNIYVAGGAFGTSMWQYNIASQAWTSLPDLPQDHGNNGSCTVSEEGYLYVGTGSLLRLFRLPLGMY